MILIALWRVPKDLIRDPLAATRFCLDGLERSLDEGGIMLTSDPVSTRKWMPVTVSLTWRRVVVGVPVTGGPETEVVGVPVAGGLETEIEQMRKELRILMINERKNETKKELNKKAVEVKTLCNIIEELRSGNHRANVDSAAKPRKFVFAIT